MVRPVRPWRKAFIAERVLPSWVRGPVDWFGVGVAALFDEELVAGDMVVLFSPGYSLAFVFGDGAPGFCQTVDFMEKKVWPRL